jgi:hypothetical protein
MEAFLYPIWFIFGSIFAYLAFMHWRYSDTPFRPFYLRDQTGKDETTSEVPEQDKLARKVVDDLNNYVGKMNNDLRNRNRLAAIGYFVAVIACIVSIFLIYVA